jgi:hypothetical protein
VSRYRAGALDRLALWALQRNLERRIRRARFPQTQSFDAQSPVGNRRASPGYSALGEIPGREDFLADLEWLGKKDRQRDNGNPSSIVDGVEARVYVHYPAP